jgi:hypothetical protein
MRLRQNIRGPGRARPPRARLVDRTSVPFSKGGRLKNSRAFVAASLEAANDLDYLNQLSCGIGDAHTW